MPWMVKKRGSSWCVIKEGESSPIPGGCHPTRAAAIRHQRALYASGAATAEGSIVMGTTNEIILTTDNSTGEIVWTIAGDKSKTAGDVFEMIVHGSPTWEGVLAIEGLPTSDGRYLMPGKITNRDLPLTLKMQKETADGHDGAVPVGKITEIYREDRPDLGDNAVAIIGRGVFADTADGREAASLVSDEVLRHVSIDLSHSESYLLDKETYEVVDEDSADLGALLNGDYLRAYEGSIMGATLCAFAAFEDATMRIVDVNPEHAVVASAFSLRKVLTASAAGIAPLAPPYDWFYKEETNGPCPLTVTPDGQVYGHLALWNQCHRGKQHSCELAPKSRAGYAYFHTGSLTTDDGRKVNVGRITVGEGGHASTDPRLRMTDAIAHYDKTGTVAAFVRAKDGRYGIWLSGAVRSDCPEEKVRDLEANAPSGDWRFEGIGLELGAILSVPVPGFPVPRYEAGLLASGDEERVVALVASGYSPQVEFTRAEQRKMTTLVNKLRTMLNEEKETKKESALWIQVGPGHFEGEPEEFRVYDAAARRRMAKSGSALPDGSFPIANCQDAKNARQAIGRTPASNRGRVRRHIAKRERALGCSND
jgi:hypothetical protein